MAKNVPKRKHTLRNVLLIVAAIPVLFILYLVITTLLDPVFDQFEKTKFDKLDQQSRELYGQLKEKSGGIETWTYEAKCEPILGGFKLVSDYNCFTELKTQVEITTIEQLEGLDEKYYPVISASNYFKAKSEPSRRASGQFRIKFVVSGVEGQYESNSDGSILCDYLTQLNNLKEEDNNLLYGSEIRGSGFASISFKCIDTSSNDWYKN